MPNLSQIMAELKKKGSAQTRKIYANHGATENTFGVKVGDMKVIAKTIKGDQELALELFDTGNLDAMYLAGIVADGKQMSRKQLEGWAKAAKWYMISEYSVPGVAHESEFAHALATKWIKSRSENIATSGWTTYVGCMATRSDDELDLTEIKSLLKDIEGKVHQAKNRVRYTMNGFVIGAGTYVKPLLKQAKATAKKIGKVDVEMGGTACKVPLATEYIEKIESKGYVGKKRKTIKC